MERWEELDQEHMKEMRKMKDLNQHEKDRLAKMQEIEKAKMRNRIKKIKSRLNSQNTQI
jgi:ferric-dicitrate binding protein FerR (iron transport regulator)